MDTSLQFNQPHLTSIQELFDGLSTKKRYDHLQLILSRNADKKELPAYYLWVSRDAFGKVFVDDLDFDGTRIHLHVQDCSTGFKKIVYIDVNDTDFQFLLIDWNDVRNMLMAENKSMFNANDLLELEY